MANIVITSPAELEAYFKAVEAEIEAAEIAAELAAAEAEDAGE